MAEPIIPALTGLAISLLVRSRINPRINALSGPASSQTKKQRYRRTRGRIVPSSSNQGVAAPPSPTLPSNTLSIGDPTNAVPAPVSHTPSGEGSSNEGVAALPSPTLPSNNLSIGDPTNAVPAPVSRTPSGEGSSNEGVAAPPSPTLPSNNLSIGDPTNAVPAPTSHTQSGEGNSGFAIMDKKLFEVSCAGRVLDLKNLVETHGKGILFTVTPYGNSPLHLAVMLGRVQLAEELCNQAPSLLCIQNIHGETPLIAALMAHNEYLAIRLIGLFANNIGDLEGRNTMKEMLVKIDRHHENALHHALRNGFKHTASVILNIEPRLAEQVNKNGESAMHMACRRGFSRAVRKMLEFPSSSYAGPNGQSALDAAIEGDHTGIVVEILRKCPDQASHINGYGNTPLCTAIEMKNSKMVEILLKYDHNLAYIANETDGYTPFLLAANLGYVEIAKIIAKHSPDSAYAITKMDEMNALHDAIQWEEHAFVDYILKNPQLHRLINQGDSSGDLPLHYAAHTCNAKLLKSLVCENNIQDYTAVNANNVNAADVIYSKIDLFETPKWKEAFEFVSTKIPSGVSQLVKEEVQVVTQEVEKIKSLTEMYTGNTSVVAALLATITFAAAFTLPGGYSTDPQDAGLPIFARKAAFQVFCSQTP